MNYRIPVLLVFCLLTKYSTAQQTDSLTRVLDTARNEVKVKALNETFRKFLPSDPVKAAGYSREALTLAQQIGDGKGLAAAYNNLGIVYRNQGALDKALNYYFKSLRLYDSLDNAEGLATTRNNISTIYIIKGDYPTAMKYLQDSYNGFNELGDTLKIAGSLNNIGNLYSDIGEFDKAQEYLNRSIELSSRMKEPYPDPRTNLGNLYYRQEKYDMAAQEFKAALALERAANNKLGVLNLLVNLGVNSVKSGQFVEAEAYLKEGFELCESLQVYSMLPPLFRAQADYFARRGNFKEAYQAQLKFNEARDRIFSEESSRKIAQMEMLLAMEEQDRKLALLEKEGKIQSLELYKSRLFIITVILGILITLGVLNYIFLSKKKIIRPRKTA